MKFKMKEIVFGFKNFEFSFHAGASILLVKALLLTQENGVNLYCKIKDCRFKINLK